MGLLAALLWGGTDFLVGLNARAVGVKRAVFFGQALGFTIMSLLLVLFPSFILKSLAAPPNTWLMGVLAAVLTVSGALALSKAFALGKAAIVAPLVTSYGVITTLLSWAGGEQISLLQILCIALCVVGVALSSLHKDTGLPHSTDSTRSIVYALLAALLYGSSFWLQGRFTLPLLGPITMLWLGYLVGLGVLLLMVLRIKDGLRIPPLKNCTALTGASLMNLGGFSAFSWGAMAGSVSVVTVISTLSGGIAAILGYVFFKERLSAVQMIGVVLVLVGAIVLHLKA
ncbi:DMT family transporter [Pseudomonas chlororaphis]|uniref:Phosphonate utilization associated putative membrane protein n=1 Tax=Pseudomonas chlororaphis TaxID=587753 RepID=A0AAX3FY05_9PSED|nr:DMT family transporter [Pseudomonas chlororaphis]AZC34716.1 Permease of the drug/metabolite transporter (DMT) superfamily [Pseudomonas chlororaphis subsp. piscium]AZC41254.1 Permease of the drug/metabolite transporter (DMT) superfamily [Pseudomonas chlororaphis subsp. piscium]AZC66994.1 Permease of the drug/metabolite transporter (DMT) superfamily [Pseudomonas chlororaphis subsp. piscium]WDG75932.1 DMT family transporter [Pseudomonas chlororaphis]WDH32276.1 DMT family transporter [Pseudomon